MAVSGAAPSDGGLLLLRQRVFASVQGYEDLSDHGTRRTDVLMQTMQTACERARALARAPTLCRLENRTTRQAAWAIHQVLLERFSASFVIAPEGHWCWTSMRPTTRCTVCRKDGSSTAATAATAICRCTCSAGNSCLILAWLHTVRYRLRISFASARNCSGEAA
ncbi:MAG: hypothetical protein EXR39_17135 [Betaproteobacteria bacterium]|nr:hypothetical protein [Betaproteobacteria bacterium]